MTRLLALNALPLKTIKLLLVSFAFFVLFAAAMPAPAHAAALTESQISAILSLLSSFGADQATINNVNIALGGNSTPTTPSPTGSPAISIVTPVGGTNFKIGDTIPLSWNVTNAPANSQVIYTLTGI